MAQIASPPSISGTALTVSRDGWPIISGTTIHLSGVGTIAAGKAGQVSAWKRLPVTALTGCLSSQRLDVAQAMLLRTYRTVRQKRRPGS